MSGDTPPVRGRITRISRPVRRYARAVALGQGRTMHGAERAGRSNQGRHAPGGQMSLRLHEIAEASHRILNPFTDEKLMLLGDMCRPEAGQRHLDLACGKGEMLCRWAKRFGTVGLGVDLSEVFLAAARARAAELD